MMRGLVCPLVGRPLLRFLFKGAVAQQEVYRDDGSFSDAASSIACLSETPHFSHGIRSNVACGLAFS
jgi:hypothetical protein